MLKMHGCSELVDLAVRCDFYYCGLWAFSDEY
jgi:hypothetical protein